MFGACLESSLHAGVNSTSIGGGIWVDSAQAGKEVIFESLYGSFGFIDSIVIGFHQLPVYILGL